MQETASSGSQVLPIGIYWIASYSAFQPVIETTRHVVPAAFVGGSPPGWHQLAT